MVGRDLLDRGHVADLRERRSSEACVTEAIAGEKRDDFLELGDGGIGGGAAVVVDVGGEIEGRIGVGIGIG